MASALSEARVIGVKALTVAVENIAVHRASQNITFSSQKYSNNEYLNRQCHLVDL
jgi:hypothetical protein